MNQVNLHPLVCWTGVKAAVQVINDVSPGNAPVGEPGCDSEVVYSTACVPQYLQRHSCGKFQKYTPPLCISVQQLVILCLGRLFAMAVSPGARIIHGYRLPKGNSANSRLHSLRAMLL